MTRYLAHVGVVDARLGCVVVATVRCDEVVPVFIVVVVMATTIEGEVDASESNLELKGRP